MEHFTKFILKQSLVGLVLFLFLGLTTAKAQTPLPDSKGKDFWLTFPNNHTGNGTLTLFITGDIATTGVVAIPGLSFSTNFSVTPGTITSVILPTNAQLFSSNIIENKGIHITSQQEITVYGLNRIQFTTDAFLALPTDILGTEYINLGYKNVNIVNATQFAIVGTTNGTIVTITPTVTTDGHPVGVPYNITLNQGQTYLLRNSNSAPSDLSGTLIKSTHPIAVFGSHGCANIPNQNTVACDYIIEQLPPNTAWGKEFVTMPLATRLNGDTFRFLASVNNTKLTINGSIVATLNKGQYYEQIVVGPAVITATEPILVAQYSNGTSFDNVTSDPFMMLIPPYEQFLGSYTVATPSSGFRGNYINVVTRTAAIGSIKLNGVTIPSGSFTPIGSSGFSGAQLTIILGTHNLTGGGFPFGTFVYGFDQADSYGYPGGQSLSKIATVETISINLQGGATVQVGTEQCLMAVAKDQDNKPVVGIRVDFAITGANPITGFATTDANGEAKFCYTGAKPGTDNIVASSGTVNDDAKLVWVKKSQTITFPPIPDKTLVDPPFTISATSTSGLPVTFSIISGPANISGNTITITGIGTVTVRASQAGNDTYNAATPVNQTFEVTDDGDPINTWNKRFGGSGTEIFKSVIQTSDGGYLLGGHSLSPISGDKGQPNQGNWDYWVVKIDASGNKVWEKTYGGSSKDYLNQVVQTSDGGYLLGGSSQSPVSGDKTSSSRGDQDFWIVKISSTGVKQWDKSYGGSGFDDLKFFVQLSNGDLVLAGESDSNMGGDKSQNRRGSRDYWVVKVTSNGTKLWDQRYGGTRSEALNSIIQTNDGGFVLGGKSVSGQGGDKSQASRGSYDYWLVKINSSGTKLWDKRFGGSGADELFSMGETATGQLYVAGTSASGANGDKTQGSQGGQDYWMLQLSSNGNLLWDKRFGGSSHDDLRNIIQTSDNGYLLAGSSASGMSGDKSQASQGSNDYWIVKTDAAGNKLWDKRYGGSKSELLRYTITTTDGGYLLGGRSDSEISGDKTQTSQGLEDYWLVKVTATGDLEVTTTTTIATIEEGRSMNREVIAEKEQAVVDGMEVNSYPNPAPASVNVSFKIPETQPVNLQVLDSKGRKVATLFQGEAEANKKYSIEWQSARQQEAGLYILHLQTKKHSTATKIILTR